MAQKHDEVEEIRRKAHHFKIIFDHFQELDEDGQRELVQKLIARLNNDEQRDLSER